MKCSKNLFYLEIFNVYIKKEDAIVKKKKMYRKEVITYANYNTPRICHNSSE